MSKPAKQEPLKWLAHVESMCVKHAHGLPQQKITEKEWVGIGFRIGDVQLVSSLGEIVEILTPPELSEVPRTKHWVWGVANVRGNLLPVMDLQGYLKDIPSKITRNSRILVVNDNGVYSGLVVDAVLGLQHFKKEFRCKELPGDDKQMQGYMTHSFKMGSEHWGVFNMHKLIHTPQFIEAAV
ncbi:MAG: chemotaxis protein CheW [Gammaproteobacteria bacterium]